MTVIDYFQSHAAGISALIGLLSFLGLVLWGVFRIAVQQVTAPRFSSLEQGQAELKTNVALLVQGQESLNKGQDAINQRLDRIEALLTRERV